MNFTKTEDFFVSANGQVNVAYFDYKPNTAPRAVLQIVHGMNEHITRYEEFIDYMAQNGIATVANDHLGHGFSAETDDDLGYFADEHGHKYLLNDVYSVTLKAKELYPNLPIIMFAHSMGSFIARLYIAEHGKELTAAVLCGTSGPLKAAELAKLEAKRIAKKHGARHRAETLDKLVFGDYNKSYEVRKTAFDWISRDEEEVKKFIDDPKTGFLFTASAFHDLFTLHTLCNSVYFYKNVPKKLPIFLIAGNHDPVGQFGRGITKVHEKLMSNNCINVTSKIYDKCRHELLHELNRDEIFEDVLAFYNSHI